MAKTLHPSEQKRKMLLTTDIKFGSKKNFEIKN